MGWAKSGHFKPRQVKLGQVKSSEDWSSPVKTDQVNLNPSQIKLVQAKSCWDIGTGQIMVG